MNLWKHYLQPSSIELGLEYLNSVPGPNVVVAGGTDLLLDMQQGRHSPVHTMVDVTGITEMREIREEGDHVFLGATATHKDIVGNTLLKQHAQCLVEACGLIGGLQVKNVATIGGNVAHALPAGDGTIALLALGAEAQIASMEGRSWRPLEELFAGPGETTFDRSRELLVGFRLPMIGEYEASAFQRVMRPQGVAIAILNMSVWLHCSMDGVVEDVRLAVGPAGPRPFRARKTEDALRGKRLEGETLPLASRELLKEARVRTSPHRATQEYRKHLIPVLLERVMQVAKARIAC